MRLLKIAAILAGLFRGGSASSEVAERQISCPADGSLIQLVISTTVMQSIGIVVINEYFKANGVITLGNGVIIEISNAPTQLVTTVATTTVSTVTETATSTVTQTNSAQASAGPQIFVLSIAIKPPNRKRQSGGQGNFVGSQGQSAINCATALQFSISQGVLTINGQSVSTSKGIGSMKFAPVQSAGDITTFFSVTDNTLHWVNDDFDNGNINGHNAVFCNQDGVIFAQFIDGAIPGCNEVLLQAVPASDCPISTTLSTSTSTNPALTLSGSSAVTSGGTTPDTTPDTTPSITPGTAPSTTPSSSSTTSSSSSTPPQPAVAAVVPGTAPADCDLPALRDPVSGTCVVATCVRPSIINPYTGHCFCPLPAIVNPENNVCFTPVCQTAGDPVKVQSSLIDSRSPSPGASDAECAAACATIPNCQSYSFEPSTGTCNFYLAFLNDGGFGAKDGTGILFTDRLCPALCTTTQVQAIFQGTAAADTCVAPTCASSRVLNHVLGTCVKPICAASGDGSVLTGSSLGSLSASSDADCATLCKSHTPRCLSFGYLTADGICRLYSEILEDGSFVPSTPSTTNYFSDLACVFCTAAQVIAGNTQDVCILPHCISNNVLSTAPNTGFCVPPTCSKKGVAGAPLSTNLLSTSVISYTNTGSELACAVACSGSTSCLSYSFLADTGNCNFYNSIIEVGGFVPGSGTAYFSDSVCPAVCDATSIQNGDMFCHMPVCKTEWAINAVTYVCAPTCGAGLVLNPESNACVAPTCHVTGSVPNRLLSTRAAVADSRACANLCTTNGDCLSWGYNPVAGTCILHRDTLLVDGYTAQNADGAIYSDSICPAICTQAQYLGGTATNCVAPICASFLTLSTFHGQCDCPTGSAFAADRYHCVDATCRKQGSFSTSPGDLIGSGNAAVSDFECQKLCASQRKCLSWVFDQVAGTCATHSDSLLADGFQAADTGSLLYSDWSCPAICSPGQANAPCLPATCDSTHFMDPEQLACLTPSCGIPGSSTDADLIGTAQIYSNSQICQASCSDDHTCFSWSYTAATGSCSKHENSVSGSTFSTASPAGVFSDASCAPVCMLGTQISQPSACNTPICRSPNLFNPDTGNCVPACAVSGSYSITPTDSLTNGLAVSGSYECQDQCMNSLDKFPSACGSWSFNAATGICNLYKNPLEADGFTFTIGQDTTTLYSDLSCPNVCRPGSSSNCVAVTCSNVSPYFYDMAKLACLPHICNTIGDSQAITVGTDLATDSYECQQKCHNFAGNNPGSSCSSWGFAPFGGCFLYAGFLAENVFDHTSKAATYSDITCPSICPPGAAIDPQSGCIPPICIGSTIFNPANSDCVAPCAVAGSYTNPPTDLLSASGGVLVPGSYDCQQLCSGWGSGHAGSCSSWNFNADTGLCNIYHNTLADDGFTFTTGQDTTTLYSDLTCPQICAPGVASDGSNCVAVTCSAVSPYFYDTAKLACLSHICNVQGNSQGTDMNADFTTDSYACQQLCSNWGTIHTGSSCSSWGFRISDGGCYIFSDFLAEYPFDKNTPIATYSDITCDPVCSEASYASTKTPPNCVRPLCADPGIFDDVSGICI